MSRRLQTQAFDPPTHPGYSRKLAWWWRTDGDRGSMVSLRNVHSHGTQKKAVSGVAFHGFNGVFVLLRIQVFSDNGVFHVGEMPADLMGASSFQLAFN